LRILFLGDSFTFGNYVDDDDPFCRVLERKSREAGVPLEVLNGGVDGYSPKNALLWFRSKGVFLDPDRVILVLFVGNDVKGELREIGDFVVRAGLLYYGNRRTNTVEETPVDGLYYWFRTRRLYQFICHRYWAIKKMLDQTEEKRGFNFSEVFEKKGFPREAEAYDRLTISMRNLANQCQEKDIGFLTVIVPTFEQVYFDELKIRERRRYDMKRPNRRVVSMSQSEGIPVLDLLETEGFQGGKGLYLQNGEFTSPSRGIKLSPRTCTPS
jgi:hypothetical protein